MQPDYSCAPSPPPIAWLLLSFGRVSVIAHGTLVYQIYSIPKSYKFKTSFDPSINNRYLGQGNPSVQQTHSLRHLVWEDLKQEGER
jgi:hypothetical protein